MDRLDLYLQQMGLGPTYVNTDKEAALVEKFVTLYSLAKAAHDKCEECNPTNIEKWRKAYNGTLNALKQDGTESNRRCRQLRKLIYELVESKIDNTIPMPKISPRYKSDIPVVNITENYLKFEVDQILTKYINDRSERATYIDGTCWYKIWWDSLDNTHVRSGNVKIDLRTADQIYPQPGVKDYRQLEYIFEKQDISLSQIYDLYGRLLTPVNGDTNVIPVISCYYLNEDRIVGLFMWSEATHQVICNEHDWQIRKVRKCTKCGTINPTGTECHYCGAKTFKYENADTEILAEDIIKIHNPYEVGETDDPTQNKYVETPFLTAGTEIPFYHIHQLPFVPRPAVSNVNSIYGKSEVSLLVELQDNINKVYTKAVDKTLKSGAIVTKPKNCKISDTDDTFKILGVDTVEQSTMIQSKIIAADTSQDMNLAAVIYDSAKSSSGITDSFQGKTDYTASSGKAKAFAAQQSAGRIESLRVMKAAAFAGVYELVFKYLLAFSDESRKFVRVLPDGNKKEEVWNKYMFLEKDKYGDIYYRDDFSFSSDPASTLSQNRVQMWQETQDKFIQGAFGNPQDPRTLKMFWNVMDSLQYPLASVALAGIEESEQHLPYEIEQAIMQNPQLQQLITDAIAAGQDGRGGARANSGPDGNGATHAANVERTNERNRSQNRDTAVSAQQAVAGGNV